MGGGRSENVKIRVTGIHTPYSYCSSSILPVHYRDTHRFMCRALQTCTPSHGNRILVALCHSEITYNCGERHNMLPYNSH